MAYVEIVQAVVYSSFGGIAAVREVSDPSCPDGGVVIAVEATGVCRSDWHVWRGHDTATLPIIPGHEFAGVVSEVGEDVRRWVRGDRVTVPFVIACGACDYCRDGQAQVCPYQRQPGLDDAGSFAERVAIDHADFNLVRLPDAIDSVTAASLGCRFAAAYRALTTHGRVREADRVAVFGCGGVGLSLVMIAVALGAEVVAVDRSARALARAYALGAATVDVGQTEDPAAMIRQVYDGGADVSIDAIGSAETAEASILSLRRRGRHIQVGLLAGSTRTPEIPLGRVVSHELEIYGSHGMAAADYPGLIDLVASGRLRPRELVGDVIGLDAAGAALAAMDTGSPEGMTVVDLRG